MTNIWGFLTQTATASLAAALLLAVKALLADKLSPRWQYGVWGVLALRLALPVSAGRTVLLPVPLFLETWKGAAERTLDSAYTAVYQAVSVRWPFPVLEGRPRSVTDWLFVLYAAGVLAALLWYLASYLRLRLLLRRGSPVSEAARARIQSVCEAYGLPSCPAVAVAGLPSAFVCGALRPVLALPADRPADDKVLLHELLHLKHRDALQSALWCVFRALHWCNPFLQYVFNRVGNDMEALCDQRVLERLTGEERREYGGILLSMADDRYPRAPGTTSVSNGGRNIARRIEAIVRFKKYPAGMGLASVCVALVLAVPVLAGTAASFPGDYYRPRGGWELERGMALARVQRCTTVAGALDTYAKGLLLKNGIYAAMASPPARHGELRERMQSSAEAGGWTACRLDAGDELEYVSRDDGYSIYNLDRQGDGSYTAALVFYVTALLDPDGGGLIGGEDGEGWKGSVLVPVAVRRENGWVVEETGERKTFPGLTLQVFQAPKEDLPWLRYYRADGKSGAVFVGVDTFYTVGNAVENGGWNPFGGASFDETAKPSAQFERVESNVCYEYRCRGAEGRRDALSLVAMELVELPAGGGQPEFPQKAVSGDTSWGDSNGNSGDSRFVSPDWDGILRGGSGGGVDTRDGLAVLPPGYAVRVYWNGEPVEDFILREAA